MAKFEENKAACLDSRPVVDSETCTCISDALQRLGQSSHQFLRTVDCDYGNGVLTLEGSVPSYYLKQLAQSVVRDVDGVSRVENHLAVVNPRGLSDVPICA